MKIYWINIYFISAFSLITAFITLAGPNPALSIAFTFISLVSSATAAAIREIGKRLDQDHIAKSNDETAMAKQKAEQVVVE